MTRPTHQLADGTLVYPGGYDPADVTELPANWWPDHDLAEAKKIKWAQVKALHAEKLEAGLITPKGEIDVNSQAQVDMISVLNYLKSPAASTSVDWTMYDNSVVAHTPAELDQAVILSGEYSEALVSKKQSLYSAIQAAVDVAAVDAIDIDSGWPSRDFSSAPAPAAVREFVFPIWAEENAALAANALEWAFGNGAGTPQDQGVVVPECELFATAACLRQGTATIGIYVNNVKVAEISEADAVGGDVNRCYHELVTPIQIPAGSVVGFRTVSASGTAGPNTVTAWMRSKG